MTLIRAHACGVDENIALFSAVELVTHVVLLAYNWYKIAAMQIIQIIK